MTRLFLTKKLDWQMHFQMQEDTTAPQATVLIDSWWLIDWFSSNKQWGGICWLSWRESWSTNLVSQAPIYHSLSLSHIMSFSQNVTCFTLGNSKLSFLSVIVQSKRFLQGPLLCAHRKRCSFIKETSPWVIPNHVCLKCSFQSFFYYYYFSSVLLNLSVCVSEAEK